MIQLVVWGCNVILSELIELSSVLLMVLCLNRNFWIKKQTEGFWCFFSPTRVSTYILEMFSPRKDLTQTELVELFCFKFFNMSSPPMFHVQFPSIHKPTATNLRPCSNLCEGGSYLCTESWRWSTDDAADAFNFSIRHRCRLKGLGCFLGSRSKSLGLGWFLGWVDG